MRRPGRSIAGPTTTGSCPTPEPSARIFERQGVHRLLSRHIPRFLWARICGVGCFSTETKFYLTHDDLLPRSVLIEGLKLTGRLPDIISSSGNIAGCMTPACACVLARIFPGPRQEREIKAVSRVIRDLRCNDPYYEG